MNQLQKYTWLIDTVRRAGKISHKGLSDRWSQNKDFSDGHELHRATFNRWHDAIYEQFGIMIDCQKVGGYLYYLLPDTEYRMISNDGWAVIPVSALMKPFSVTATNKKPSNVAKG